MSWMDILKTTATISSGPKKRKVVRTGYSAGAPTQQRNVMGSQQQLELDTERAKREIDGAKKRMLDSKRKMTQAAKNDPRRDSSAFLQAEKNYLRDLQYLKDAESQMPQQKPQTTPSPTPPKAPTNRRAIPATSPKERAYQDFRLTSAANKLRNKRKEELSEGVKEVLKPPVEERQRQLRGPPRKFTNAQMLARSKKNQETPTEEVARRIREENEVRQRTLDRIKRGPSGSPTRQYAKTGGN